MTAFCTLLLGTFPFLLRWENVLSGTYALHCRFIRYKSVTRTEIYVSRPLIIRYISVKRTFFPLHHRYLCGHCVFPTRHTPIACVLSGKAGKFYHRITQICILCPFFLRYIFVIRSDRALNKSQMEKEVFTLARHSITN